MGTRGESQQCDSRASATGDRYSKGDGPRSRLAFSPLELSKGGPMTVRGEELPSLQVIQHKQQNYLSGLL